MPVTIVTANEIKKQREAARRQTMQIGNLLSAERQTQKYAGNP